MSTELQNFDLYSLNVETAADMQERVPSQIYISGFKVFCCDNKVCIQVENEDTTQGKVIISLTPAEAQEFVKQINATVAETKEIK